MELIIIIISMYFGDFIFGVLFIILISKSNYTEKKKIYTLQKYLVFFNVNFEKTKLLLLISK